MNITGLYSGARALRHSNHLKESMELSLDILQQLGEPPLRPISDTTLLADLKAMDVGIEHTSDNSILKMDTNNDKKHVFMMKLYSNLIHMLHFIQPSLLGSVSLRMVEKTLDAGFCSLTPLSLAYYGEVQVSLGVLSSGCRLGESLYFF